MNRFALFIGLYEHDGRIQIESVCLLSHVSFIHLSLVQPLLTVGIV